MYDAQADTVNVADIVTTENNKLILHNMRINWVKTVWNSYGFVMK